MQTNILTIDVEDNFTYEELVNKDDWGKYEGQVVENTLRILSLLKNCNASATFFVVGRVAERHPELIKYILEGKHEIASHSYWHRPLKKMKMDEIEQDIKMSAEVLSALSRGRTYGYRAMGYSIPENEIEFYRMLKQNGYTYDSSKKIDKDYPCTTMQNDVICNVYPSVLNLFGKRILFSGGTYLRFLPLYLINKGFSSYSQNNQPVMVYVHPWEFNKDQPNRNVSLSQKILQSPITFSTENKINHLLKKYKFTSIMDYLDIN